MKLNLRKVMAFGAAALIGLGASAQTLTTVWEQALGGTPASGDCRFGMGMNGKVYAVNKATNTLLSWDATGVTEVATNADVFTGTGITRDDAGNILVNKGFPNATSTTDWTIIPADGSDYISLTLVMPEGVEASRTDCVGRVVGDVMSAEGGYIFITTNKGNAVAMVKIVEGAQDESSTLASPVWSNDTFDATTVAQPAYSTVEELEGAADPSTACYWRKRGNIAIYGWDLENGTDEIKNLQPLTDGTNTARSSDGFDVFTLGGVVYGITSYGTVNYCDGLAVHNLATGEVVATSETKYTAGSAVYQGIFTEVVDENTVNIYQYVSGQYARQLQFTLAAAEPEALKFGYVKNVTAGEKYLIVANDSILAAPLAESQSYGYLSTAIAPAADGYIEQADSTNIFTIEAVEGGYTIKDQLGRYLYQSGSYKSFNVATELPAEGGVWTIEAQADGTVKILNASVNKWIQYSVSYTSYGSYDTEQGLMPALYQLGATAEEKPVVTVKTEVANIAEFIENADVANAVTITGTVTVVDQAGSYLFVQDETGKMVVYSNALPTYAKGDQLTGINGVWSPYNGLPQMKPTDAANFGTAVAGTAIEPEVLTLEEISIDNLLAYIKIEGVTVPESTSASYTITDATGSATMYNSAYITVPTGENLTIVGFISCYNTNVQILPVSITSASGLEVVEAPVFNPASGAIAPTQEISISCATEGASIYFTVDGTEPSETNGTLYSTPFVPGKEVTVKAIAVKEGMANSAVVEATYTMLSASAATATFNFTAPSTLTPAQEEPAFGQSIAIVVNDITFTAGDNNEISLSFAKNSATTDCRIWAGNSAYDLRTYATSTFTIAATNAKILGIEFTGSKTSATTYLTADNGTFEDKTWSGEATAVTFTTVKTTNINTITVTYEADSNGVDAIEVDADAPVEYYNLQGVKVANPESGLYIRVQGNKATKVLVK